MDNDDAAALEKQGLYTDASFNKLFKDIDKLKARKAAPYTIDDFTPFDSLSFCGNTYAKQFFDSLQLSADSLLLDLCAGIGSTARLAHSICGSRVVAVELLEGFHRISQTINEMCGITGIQTLNDSATSVNLAELGIEGRCDVVYSIQSFLHITAKEELFSTCFRAVKNGGVLYIEDHIRENELPLTEEEQHYCEINTFHDQIILQRYQTLLEQAGLQLESAIYRRNEFSRFVFERAENWLANKKAIQEEYGDFWDVRVLPCIEFSIGMYHNLGMSVEEAKHAYPRVVEHVGQAEFERILGLPHKFTGIHLIVRKP